jgi:bifunctional DNase/RNase
VAAEQVEHPSFRVMILGELAVPLPQLHAELVLTEAEAPHRSIVIPVALADAATIALAKERQLGPRPSSQELLCEVLAQLNVDVIAVRLTDEQAGVFYAELDLMTQRGRQTLSCRPSDAIALALRQTVPAPILADERLLGA